MSRLYLRIFISFWLVIILTIAAVVVINDRLERAQADDVELSERAQRLGENMQARAAEALRRGGPEGLARWADATPERGRRLSVYVHDAQGQELLGRRPPRDVRRMAERWQAEGTLPAAVRRGQFSAALEHAEHGRFLIVLNPPPRPVLLRLFGPLGMGGLIALAIIFSGLVCLWLARTISRPVQQLRLAGQALGRGRLDARAPDSASRRGDELGDLARDFNRMAERLQGLIDGQRQLLRDVSHELRSPLARIQVALALASDEAEADKRSHSLKRIEIELERLDQLIGEILGFARISQGPEPDMVTFDLAELLEDVAESARLEGQPRQLQVDCDVPGPMMIQASEALLHRAIENVVRNALRHSPERGRIQLAAARAATPTIEITISDQGPGVPRERLGDIFEPFVRLSSERGEIGSGGGIGLAIARAAIERHGGHITAENRPEGGLRVRLLVPAERR